MWLSPGNNFLYTSLECWHSYKREIKGNFRANILEEMVKELATASISLSYYYPDHIQEKRNKRNSIRIITQRFLLSPDYCYLLLFNLGAYHLSLYYNL